MTDVRITCITLSDTNAIHEHITHVGSPQFNPKGSNGRLRKLLRLLKK